MKDTEVSGMKQVEEQKPSEGDQLMASGATVVRRHSIINENRHFDTVELEKMGLPNTNPRHGFWRIGESWRSKDGRLFQKVTPTRWLQEIEYR